MEEQRQRQEEETRRVQQDTIQEAPGMCSVQKRESKRPHTKELILT